jgi:hypothetical protein
VGPSVFLKGAWRWVYFVPGLLPLMMLLMLTGFTRKRANNRVRAQVLMMQQMRARALAD